MEMILSLFWISEIITKLFFSTVAIAFLILIVFLFRWTSSEDINESFRPLKNWIIGLSITLTICILFPSQKIIWMYASIKGGEAVINLPEFAKARDLLNKTLDKYLEEENQK